MVAGELALPADGVAEPFVDAEDIADVAVAALTEDGHAGQLYELTGPRLLTFAEAVEEIARATGRPISYTPISVEEFTAALDAARRCRRARRASSSRSCWTAATRKSQDGVQRALGRAPRDFREYARTTAANGVWS